MKKKRGRPRKKSVPVFLIDLHRPLFRIKCILGCAAASLHECASLSLSLSLSLSPRSLSNIDFNFSTGGNSSLVTSLLQLRFSFTSATCASRHHHARRPCGKEGYTRLAADSHRREGKIVPLQVHEVQVHCPGNSGEMQRTDSCGADSLPGNAGQLQRCLASHQFASHGKRTSIIRAFIEKLCWSACAVLHVKNPDFGRSFGWRRQDTRAESQSSKTTRCCKRLVVFISHGGSIIYVWGTAWPFLGRLTVWSTEKADPLCEESTQDHKVLP